MISRNKVSVLSLSVLLTLLLGITLTSPARADRGDGYGYGPGYMMMWTDPNGELKLSSEQREKIYAIQREMRKKQWDLMEQMQAVMTKVYPLMNADKRDTKAILAAFEPSFKLHRQMLEIQIETANRIDAVLTPEQRKTINDWRGQGYGPQGGMGPGMMGGGYGGRGMMGGYGYNGRGMMGGYGYGPGMMGGYGGMGMMGGYGGFGMMGGYGGMGMMMGGFGGPGMMGGYGGMGMMGGYGMDMMGVGPLGMLDLSDKQRDQIYDIQRDMRKQHWELMEDMFKAMDKVNELMSAEKRDSKAILAAYEPIYGLQKKMLEFHIDAANRIDAVLTAEQRKQVHEWRNDAPAVMWGR